MLKAPRRGPQVEGLALSGGSKTPTRELSSSGSAQAQDFVLRVERVGYRF
jgi:hypothetical protein